MHRQKIITLLPQGNLSMDSTHCYRCFIPHEGSSKYDGCWTQTERNSLVFSDCNLLSISLMSSIFWSQFSNKYLHQFNLLSLFFPFIFCLLWLHWPCGMGVLFFCMDCKIKTRGLINTFHFMKPAEENMPFCEKKKYNYVWECTLLESRHLCSVWKPAEMHEITRQKHAVQQAFLVAVCKCEAMPHSNLWQAWWLAPRLQQNTFSWPSALRKYATSLQSRPGKTCYSSSSLMTIMTLQSNISTFSINRDRLTLRVATIGSV